MINNDKNYNDIKSKDIKEETILVAKYKINKQKIKIFGSLFVKNNKKNCKIICEEKEYELKDEFDIVNKQKEILEIELKCISSITDISNLFSGCESLISLTGLSNLDTSKMVNMESIFSGCISLLSIPDISNWDISNVMNISLLFNNCQSLSSLPDISKWNTNNIIDMSFLFNGCISLTSLPDISKWKLNEYINKEMMFNNCISLSYIPEEFLPKKNDLLVYSLIGPIHLDYSLLNLINNISSKV